MKKILNFLKERPVLTIQLTVLAFLLAALAVSMAILISVKPWNLMNNSIDNCYADKARVTIDLEPEERTYESIKTLYFTFYDDRGNETAFSDGNVDLTKLIGEMNRYLTTVHNRVCSIGVVGSKLFIQLDTRYEDDRTKQMNIVTVKDDLGVYDWAEVLEAVHSKQLVQADYLLSYRNDVGNVHYMYIYCPISDSDTSEVLDGAILN